MPHLNLFVYSHVVIAFIRTLHSQASYQCHMYNQIHKAQPIFRCHSFPVEHSIQEDSKLNITI